MELFGTQKKIYVISLIPIFSNNYSVKQSDGNSFCGDFDRFNKVFRDEDNILDWDICF